MPKLNPEQKKKIDAIKSKLVQIRDAGLLPKGYATTVAEMTGVKESRVYDVSSGRSYNEEVADALLELASANKLEEQLKKADEILKK